MIATIGTQVSNARNLNNSKELIRFYRVVVFENGRWYEPIDVRCWMGKSKCASIVHASIWVHADGVSTSGHGTAGGGGYDKQSAAIDNAIASAGITLSRSIDGRGDSAVRDAIHAIASALGYSNFTIVEG